MIRLYTHHDRNYTHSPMSPCYQTVYEAHGLKVNIRTLRAKRIHGSTYLFIDVLQDSPRNNTKKWQRWIDGSTRTKNIIDTCTFDPKVMCLGPPLFNGRHAPIPSLTAVRTQHKDGNIWFQKPTNAIGKHSWGRWIWLLAQKWPRLIRPVPWRNKRWQMTDVEADWHRGQLFDIHIAVL